MEPNQDNGNRISRKSFLRICGSVIAGGSILGVTGNLLWKMFTRPDDIFYGVDKKSTTINRSHVNNIVGRFPHLRYQTRSTLLICMKAG